MPASLILTLLGLTSVAAEPIIAFAPSPELERFAHEAVATSREANAKAHALYGAILALKRRGAIAADRDNTPKARPPKTAAELMALALAPEAEGDRRAGCYELSVLYVAAARAVGLAAVGVEREEAVGTGQIGHIMAGVRSSPGGRLTVFDLQNEALGSAAAVRELSDAELAAHHYNHLAVAAYLNQTFAVAQAAIDRALALAPENPSFLNNRATVLLARGEPILAMAEAAHAVELAPGVPLFRYQLGRIYLLTGDLPAAIVTLTQALTLRPRYGLARRDLGWARLLAGDDVGARRELELARQHQADTPDVLLYLGLALVAGGEAEQAGVLADEALAHGGESDPSLVALRALARRQRGADPAGVARLQQVLDNVAEIRRRQAGARED